MSYRLASLGLSFVLSFSTPTIQAQQVGCELAMLGLDRAHVVTDGDTMTAVISAQAAVAGVGSRLSSRQAAAMLLRHAIVASYIAERGGTSVSVDLGPLRGFELSCGGIRFFGYLHSRSAASEPIEQGDGEQRETSEGNRDSSRGAAESTGVQSAPLGRP